MDKTEENKTEIKDKIINFFNNNKTKIYIFIFILVTSLVFFSFLKINNEKKNTIVAEKYIEAGIYLGTNKKKDDATKIYEEIILSGNKFYSILALNTVIEKNLILDKNKILEYFEILEESISTKNQKDLISLKKGIYLIKNSDIQLGNKILKKLIEENSSLKVLARELVQE